MVVEVRGKGVTLTVKSHSTLHMGGGGGGGGGVMYHPVAYNLRPCPCVCTCVLVLYTRRYGCT